MPFASALNAAVHLAGDCLARAHSSSLIKRNAPGRKEEVDRLLLRVVAVVGTYQDIIGKPNSRGCVRAYVFKAWSVSHFVLVVNASV